MLMKNKAEEAAQQILEAFADPNGLPKPIATVFVNRHDGSPCRKWTWRNQLIVAINGFSDGRGFRQWEKVGRQVKSGQKSFRILSPLKKTIVEEETEKERVVIYGFRGTAVFGVEQTEGDPLPNNDDGIQEWLRNLPLREVAEEWNLSVEAFSGRGAHCIGKYRYGKAIALGVEDLSTWCHELIHAADHRNGKLKGSKVKGEIVAELGGAVLLTLIGYDHEADLGGCWEYIQQFAGTDNEKALKKCGEVLGRTCEAVALILDTADALPACLPDGDSQQQHGTRRHPQVQTAG